MSKTCQKLFYLPEMQSFTKLAQVLPSQWVGMLKEMCNTFVSDQFISWMLQSVQYLKSLKKRAFLPSLAKNDIQSNLTICHRTRKECGLRMEWSSNLQAKSKTKNITGLEICNMSIRFMESFEKWWAICVGIVFLKTWRSLGLEAAQIIYSSEKEKKKVDIMKTHGRIYVK